MSSSSSQPPSPPTDDFPSPAAKSDSRSSPASSPDPPSASYACQWENCTRSLSDPEILYTHLCNDHIGRKSTNNLCLTCKWNGCGTTCAKRDHITSHLRVHTPLKPHVCEICKKTFKRPQDLKKHEKIHTEEHHAQHKHSKAVTVPDPTFNNRVRRESAASGSRIRMPPGHLSDKDVIGLLPTPSPEMIHPSAFVSHPQPRLAPADPYAHPTWETIRPDGSSAASTGVGMKRAHDYGVDDFFADVKKRRLVPSYDSQMAARLSDLAYQASMTGGNMGPSVSNQTFNPRSISLNIRTPEELAALNQFLLTLGRDAEPRPADGANSYNSFFDMTQLNQLGLGSMPGIGGFGGATGYSASGSQNAPSFPSQNQWPAGMYPGLHDMPNAYDSRRMPMGGPNLGGLSLSGYPMAHAHGGHMQPTPPLETGSPASATSSTPTMTPPRRMDFFDAAFEPHVHRRQNVPAAVLAAPDYAAKTMRNVIPLRTLPARASASNASSPESESSVESIAGPPTPPRTPLPPVRNMFDKQGQDQMGRGPLATSSSLYPLLTSGDKDLKLPPLRSTVSSADLLPSLRTLRQSTPTDERLARGFGRLNIDRNEERKRHALLIRDLLLAVNERYAREVEGRPLPPVELVARTVAVA